MYFTDKPSIARLGYVRSREVEEEIAEPDQRGAKRATHNFYLNFLKKKIKKINKNKKTYMRIKYFRLRNI